MDSLDLLPKDHKQVMAKCLIDLNLSASKVASKLGISRATAYRYADNPTPEDLRQYETEIKLMFATKQAEIFAALLNEIENMIDTGDLKSLTGSYSAFAKNIFNSIDDGQAPKNNQQMAVHFISEEKENFGI